MITTRPITSWRVPIRPRVRGTVVGAGWVAGGGKGVAVVSWYHTTAGNKDASGIDWTVPVAQVRGLTTGHPSVIYGEAANHSVHHGPICTLGTFCGILPGSSDDRSMLDFFKVAVAPDGMPAVTWSDNNRIDGGPKTGVGYARQVSGPSAFLEKLPSTTVTPPKKPVTPVVPAKPSTGNGHLAATGLGGPVPLVALVLLVSAVGVRRRCSVRR